jgi:uncharacterized membrane protein
LAERVSSKSGLRRAGAFFVGTLGLGVLIIAPVYLAILVLLKALASLKVLVQPLAVFLPDWVPAENLLALVLILVLCFLVGLMASTARGGRVWEIAERSVFERIPGYSVLRGLTQQFAGKTDESWQPALVEIEEALVPAFIIERRPEDFTVFVPSAPTPMVGAIYILQARRVHPLDVPLTQALKMITRWGSGGDELMAAFRKGGGQLP